MNRFEGKGVFISSLTISQVYFVDKQRNAAVVIGDRDLKTDVNNKRKRERYSDHDEKHFVTRCQDAGRG